MKMFRSPRDQWHSFDSSPWLHPWLTSKNISLFREFSDSWLSKLGAVYDSSDHSKSKKYGFVGNMANNLYMRASAIECRKMHIDVFLHPHDTYLMSQPGWEEYDGVVPEGVSNINDVRANGILLPKVDCLRDEFGDLHHGRISSKDLLKGMRSADLRDFKGYYSYMPLLAELNKYDALLSAQTPYLAYLSGAPYCVTQMGGEVWYDCSRDDLHGILQRQSYKYSKVFLFSNPWSLAFARRYKFSNLIYVPLLINERKYSPGSQDCREEWQQKVGGSFFVLMTSRIDFRYKGTDIALDGFTKFSSQCPSARLVLLGWGGDFDKNYEELKKRGLESKVLVLSVSGKMRLIKYLRSADCVLDQISLGYYGATALEAMACEKPVIMKINENQYNALLQEGAPPVCNVENAEGVFKSLVKLKNDRPYRELMGKRSREWFISSHSNEKWGKCYETILWGLSEGLLPKFYGSPLKKFRSSEERKYLSNELKNAPKFPNYF